LTLLWVPPGEEEAGGHYDVNEAVNLPTTRYYYDGQMAFEDDYAVESGQEAVDTVMGWGRGAGDTTGGRGGRRATRRTLCRGL
jgi:hypothetical protein